MSIERPRLAGRQMNFMELPEPLRLLLVAWLWSCVFVLVQVSFLRSSPQPAMRIGTLLVMCGLLVPIAVVALNGRVPGLLVAVISLAAALLAFAAGMFTTRAPAE